MILQTFKSLTWVDFYLYSLIDPRALYRKIRDNELSHVVLSFSVPAFIAFVNIIVFPLMGSGESSFFYYKITYGWILFFLLSSLKIVVESSLMDLLSQFLGFRGNIQEMISMINFSLFPQVFLLPMLYIFVVFRFAPLFFYMFFSICLMVWSAIIAVQGISEMHSTTLGKAALIYLFPVIFIGTIFFFVIGLVAFSMMGFLAG